MQMQQTWDSKEKKREIERKEDNKTIIKYNKICLTYASLFLPICHYFLYMIFVHNF